MRWLLVPALALLLAGCTTSDPGRPTAGGRPTETTSAATSATTSAASNRPRNIDLTSVDLCEMLAGIPRATFGLDTDRPPLPDDSSTFAGAKQCFNNGIQQNLALLIVGVVDQGTAEYLDGANATVDQTDANGFPLYVLTTPDSPESCFGALDVNDGQMLFVNYGLGAPDTQPATPQTTLCQRIPDIARALLAAL